MSISKDLVSLIRGRDISRADQHSASLFLLDALATAYAGAATPVGKKLIHWCKADALNSRTQTFLMGSLTHITETDDLHRASVTHPGCVVVPAVLTAAQRTKADGEAVLLATLYGFEAMCRIGRAVGAEHYKLWHNTATCGPFGSAMAVCQLLNLTEEQCVYALGNAGTQSSGLWQFLSSGAMSKHLHAGRASESGLLSAELAQHDFTGAADILEGEQGMFRAMCPDANPESVLANAQLPWELTQTSIKPWPSCRHTHPVIDAAIELQAKLGNAVIEQIDIGVYRAADTICNRKTVDNEYQAKFSLQHCSAMALLNGELNLSSFTDGARENTRELCEKTRIHVSEHVEANYPDSWGVELTLSLSDGKQISASRKDCRGDPELPLNDDEMLSKAKDLMHFGGLSAGAAQDVCDSVLRLAEYRYTVSLMDDFLAHVMNTH